MVVKRFGLKDRSDAKRLFLLMSEVFGEDCAAKNNRYLDQLLAREDFWVVAAYSGEDIIGGVTAYTLPLTRQEIVGTLHL